MDAKYASIVPLKEVVAIAGVQPGHPAVASPTGLEGTNNKLGVLKRIAYVFRQRDNFAARALLWWSPIAS